LVVFFKENRIPQGCDEILRRNATEHLDRVMGCHFPQGAIKHFEKTPRFWVPTPPQVAD
jgi:hypothetical protein